MYVFSVWLCIAWMCSYCNMVRWTWWDWSLILRRTTTSFSALTMLVGSFDPLKPVPDMTYNVFSGTSLNLLNQSVCFRTTGERKLKGNQWSPGSLGQWHWVALCVCVFCVCKFTRDGVYDVEMSVDDWQVSVDDWQVCRPLYRRRSVASTCRRHASVSTTDVFIRATSWCVLSPSSRTFPSLGHIDLVCMLLVHATCTGMYR